MRADSPENRESWLTFRKLGLAAFSVLFLLALDADSTGLSAQTLNDRLTRASATGERSRMLVDAKEIIYDRDRDRVTASGDVQIYYQGKVLEADRVIYDRKTKRVYAEGNARMTDSDGTKSFGTRFDLTDDFRDGFIDSLRVETVERNRFSAARAERTDGETTVFQNGTFTSCEPCKDNPERPPLWQVKAARIIHKNSERRIYYENATIEFWGVPVAWIPFFNAPDPSVRNLSGVLPPRFMNKTRLGRGVSLPIFWSIAPNYDLTFTPTALSRQGAHLDLFWRHRLEHGSYNLRVNGIWQERPELFPTQPFLGAGTKDFRGSVESRGKFYLNEKWAFGWNAAWATDKHYFTDYKIKPQTLSNMFLSESISEIYLRGQGARSRMDISAFAFLGLTAGDWQKQIERVAPSYDFDRRFTLDNLGGELRLSANGAAIQREAALFQALAQPSNPTFTPGGLLYAANSTGLYMPCIYSTDGGLTTKGAYRPGQCLLRGFAGEYARNTAEMNWRRRFIDPLGQEWTPFFGMRADFAYLRQNLSGFNSPDQTLQGFNGPGFSNAQQSNFLGSNRDNFLFRAMPSLGLEYRYPFFAQTALGTHHVEPIAQVILRPNETQIGNLPNEDAQSLVFDENSIFSINKFSGYDRVEGGSRLNYGGRYSFRSNGEFFTSVLFGQSVHLAGRNSFAAFDLANTGRNSGLESSRSDYVTAVTVQPFSNMNFTARGRYDERNLSLRRFDLSATSTLGKVNFSAVYTRISPQPELGYPLRREGLFLQSTVDLPQNFYVAGSVLFDMDRYLSQRSVANTLGQTYSGTQWRVAATTLGMGYRDECTDFSVTYTRANSDYLSLTAAGGQPTNRTTSTILMRLTLRDLIESQFSNRTR